MAPFFYIFVPIFSSFLLKGNGVSQRHMEVGLFFLASASMFLLLGFRGHDVGTDTPNYYLSFFRIGDAESYLDVRYEPAYVFLSMAIDSLGFGPEIMIAACSLIIIFSVSYFIYHLSPAVGLSLVLYAGLFGYFFAFNGMRQAVAQSLVLLGFALYEKKSKNMGFLVYLSAPLFHFTALFFFPLLLTFFIRKEFFKVFLPLAWVVSLSFVVSSEPFKFVSSTIFKFVPSVYEHFVVNASFSGSIGAVDFLYQLIFIFIYISFLMRGSAVENRIMLMGMFGVLVSNFLNYSGFVSRVSYFWEGFLIAAIPVAIFSVYKSFSRAFLCFIFFSVSSLFYFRAVFVGSNKVTPYYSWLFNF